jgi:hypothetical protein
MTHRLDSVGLFGVAFISLVITYLLLDFLFANFNLLVSQ